jgi:DNA-binding CsgD family transcriptional regulator/signal transduction histidine kinase
MSELPFVAGLTARARALPPLLVDGALVAVVLISQLWPFLDGPRGWWGMAMVFGSALPLLWRRQAPFAVLAVSMLATTLYDLGGPEAGQPVWYGGLITMATVASRSRRRARLVALGVISVLGLAAVGSSDTALRGLILFGAAYAIGRSARTSRAYAAALEDRADRLERERELEAERAAAAERARIARDMHDILAHAVSIMVVQAEAGPLVVRTVTRRLIADYTSRPATNPKPDLLPTLTVRERETLILIARGLSNAEIATAMILSEHTVKTHVSNVLAKLGLRDRVQAVMTAYESGLVVANR